METQVTNRLSVEDLIGRSDCVQQLRARITKLASHDVNLLLQGESGTGKELIANIVHEISRRRKGHFLGVNCAAIHETLLESELFGHEAGAFTGASHGTLGFFRAADGGTILLDEVGDMSESLQRKLLRVLQEREVVPVGGTRSVQVDVRIIAASNSDLGHAVKQGTFRADLYYRLNVLGLWIPPLRQRPRDIPILAQHLLTKVADLLQIPRKHFSSNAMDVLMDYGWPGNVRELGNVIQRAYVFCDSPVIDVSDLPETLFEHEENDAGFVTLQKVTRRHVEEALEVSNGVRTRAAKILGIDRKTLWRMIHRYDLV